MAKFDAYKIIRYKIIRYRLQCEATWEDDGYGCSGNGPAGDNKAEAKELAQENGWEYIEGYWVCPSHANAKHNERLAKHTYDPVQQASPGSLKGRTDE